MKKWKTEMALEST